MQGICPPQARKFLGFEGVYKGIQAPFEKAFSKNFRLRRALMTHKIAKKSLMTSTSGGTPPPQGGGTG